MKQKLLKSMLLLCILVGGVCNAWATDYSYTFSSQQYAAAGAKTLNGVSWIMAGTGGSFFGYDGTKGQQFGSGNKPFSAMSLTTSGISGTITSVVVNTSGASSISGTVAVSVDGNNFECNDKTTASLTTTATDYEFTGSASGEIVISWAQSSKKAVYVKSITVTYSTGGGSEPSITLGKNTVNATEAAVSTTSIEVTYNNLTNYIADVNFYEADGTTDATYDHSWLTAEINGSTNNLDYSIEANTGAARTVYLKVYAVGDEGEAESSLITITQAKKSVASPEFNLEGGSYMQGTEITLTSAGNTIYYNMTTDGTDPATPTSGSTLYSEPIALGNSTAKIWAIAYDTYGNKSSVVKRTYTGVALASLPFSWTGTKDAGKADLAGKTGVALSLASDYAASNAPYRLKFDDEGKYVTIYLDGKPEAVHFTAKLLGGKADTGSKIKVQGSDDGLSFTDIEEFTMKGAANATFEFTTSNAFAPTHRAVKLVMSSKDQNVGVGTISINCIPVTLTSEGYATYASTYPLDFTNSNIKAYIATAAEGSAVNLSAVNKVPANTGVVLNHDGEITENIPVFDGKNADDVSDNLLLVSDGKVKGGTGIYALANKNHGVGFYLVNSSVTIPNGKAYLQTTANTKEFLNFDFSDDETGINTVNGSELMVNSPIYNLSGQRMSKLQKGINIVNGKKVLF
ncbi:MAG: chitobiase/beta-hexosaminidase C-terminal domain-containing protein [Bacteroidaceae bacterium]|nr:chitobiase/beta-hexosaminidase C-terminal domain-containing protein [Bacteroidaceae bacterium]